MPRPKVFMDPQILALRQQVAAAEFLLQSLRAQLSEAEQKAAKQRGTDIRDNAQRSSDDRSIAAADHGGIENNELVDNQDTVGDGVDGDATSPDQDGDDDAPGETVNDNADLYHLPSLEVGLTYPTLEDVKRAAVAHAISQGWTCGVDKRDKTRLLLKCRTGASCPFHLRAEQYEHGARIAAYRPEHTCEFKPDQSHIPRNHSTSLRFLQEQLPTFMTVDDSTTAQQIQDAVYQRFGTRISLKQCRGLRTGPKRKRKPSVGTCGICGAIGHNKKTCGRVQVPTP